MKKFTVVLLLSMLVGCVAGNKIKTPTNTFPTCEDTCAHLYFDQPDKLADCLRGC